MQKFCYEKDGKVFLVTFTQSVTPLPNYILLETIPKEPIESWYIEGGQIKIDQQKLIEFNRKNMPTLTTIEFDVMLVDARLYDQVQTLIQSDIKLKIAYTRATFFSRTDPFVDQVRIALNLTDEQVDTIWESSLV